MSPTNAREPAIVALLLWGAPLVVLIISLSVNWPGLQDGLQASDRTGVALGAVILIIVSQPLFFTVSRVYADIDGLTIRHYLRPKIVIGWNNIQSAELFTVEGGIQVIKVVKNGGKRVRFTSRMSQFERLLNEINLRSPMGLTRHSSRPGIGPSKL